MFSILTIRIFNKPCLLHTFQLLKREILSVFFILNSYQKWELTITKKHQPYILKHLFENKLVSMVYINACNFLFTTIFINIRILVDNDWSSLFQIEADTPIAKLGKPKEILVSPLKIGPVRKIMFDSHIPIKVLSTNIQRYDLKPSNKYKCKSSQYLDLHVYHPQRSWGKVIFSACVKNFVQGGVCPIV